MKFKTLRSITVSLLNHLRMAWDDKTMVVCEINDGYCYIWALLVKKFYPDAKLCSVGLYGGHAFVLMDGLFYDCETITGVNDWKDLNFFIGNNPTDNDMKFQSKKDFVKYWNVKQYFKEYIETFSITIR